MRQSATNFVVDSSAVLAAIYREPGAAEVDRAIAVGVAISAVNLSEVIARLGRNFDALEIQDFLRPLELNVFEFNESAAWSAAAMIPLTQSRGLSLGDRACLALGKSLDWPVMTADRIWNGVDVGVEVRLCR